MNKEKMILLSLTYYEDDIISDKEERKRLRIEKKKKKLLEQLRQSLPKLESEIAVKGLKKPARILREKWGIPHVFTENDNDLFFIQGYIHTQDR